MIVSAEQLDQILDLYHRGQMLRAHAAAQAIGPMRKWRGAAARIVAGRLAMNLGAPGAGRTLHRLALREAPNDPEARYYGARAVFERRGPLPLWEMLCRHGELPDAPPRIRADWFALHGHVLGLFRDFETAEKWQARAEELAPDRAWLQVERSTLLEREDKYAEAMAAARRALELHPWYRPGVQAVAHLLQLNDRDREALELLREASVQLENGPIVMQLATLEQELGLHAEARASWERAVELSPLMEKGFRKWIAGRRSDAAYYCGDYATAADLAEQCDHAFFKETAKRLRENNGQGKRAILKVGFVRQHHMTCAPATLSAISRFWSMPAEHLEVAETICYDGTPAHSERSWADQNGYVAREFTVIWDSAVALIDRGVPFTFTTVEPASAHLQAVIGYDAARGTLLIRDPYMRNYGEFLADATFDRYKATGPRGMLLVPKDRAAELLAGIDLPEADLYDALYAVQQALVEHQRDRAREAYERMAEKSPGHRLTYWARRSLASYDSNVTEGLAAIDGLLELFPTDANLRLAKLSYLSVLARRDERLALLKEAVEQKDSDPIFLQYYALELKEDAREHPAAMKMLRRALRFRALEAATFRGLADIHWEQRRTDESVAMYRFAACIQDKDENLVRTYFIASRHLKQTAAAMHLLRDRLARFGRKSSEPVRSLFWAHEQLNQDDQGFRALEDAIGLRPKDADLLLFAATAYARHGKFAKADELMASAKGKTHGMSWLRAAAEIAWTRGQLAEARELWRQIVDAEPLAADAHRMLAQLLAETESPAAALAHLEAAANRFPHNYRITQLWVEWSKEEGPTVSEPIIRRLIAIHPADAWARRELVTALLGQNRAAEALEEAQTAIRLDPSNPSSHFHLGLVLGHQGKLTEAREAFRAAISISVDADYAIYHLIFACDSIAQKKDALAFVQQQLVKQTIFGDGLLAYRAHAREVLDAEELLKALREALEARPDLWHAWSAVSAQLSEMGRLEEAERVANQAGERFPLLPRIWLDVAAVNRAQNQPQVEIAALKTALEINPTWGQAVRQLSEVHERLGHFETSRELLEQAVKTAPLDPYNHGCLADALWKLGRREEALERIQNAVKIEPGYQWAWDALVRWSDELRRPELAGEIARELTTRRAGEARSWIVLARTLRRPEDLDERLAALTKAIELNPRALDAYDLRARLLAEANRFDEAIAACCPVSWEHLPSRLQARAAWIEAQRGNYADAIAKMRQVVQDDPNMYWAWACLADWYRATGAKEDYLKTAELMTRLWPLEVVPMGYLGEAKLWAGDRDGARQLLRAAMERFPDYDFAAATLFDIEIDDRNRDAAAAALRVLRLHAPGLMTQARGVQFAAHYETGEAAVAALRELAFQETPEAEPLELAARAMADAHMREDVIRVLGEAVQRPNVAPITGGLLVEQLCKLGRWTDARTFVETKIADGEVGRSAGRALFYHLAEGQQKRELDRLLRARGDLLRRDTELWGWAGYALHSTRQYARAAEWMADWRGRGEQAEPWMLVNLAEALRATGRDIEASEIHRHALALAAPPTPRSIHAVWLASDAALAGMWADVNALLARVDDRALRPCHQFLRGLVDAVVAAGPQQRPLPEVRKVLEDAERLYPAFRDDRELRIAYRRCVKWLAKLQAGVGAWWYYLNKRFAA